MFGIGASELLVILVAALIIFGPARLPEMGRMVGKALAEMRRATQEIQDHIQLDVEEPPEPRRRERAEPEAASEPDQGPDTDAAAPDEAAPDQAVPDEAADDSLAELTLEAARQEQRDQEDGMTNPKT